jgi:hypothetical protein
MIDGSAPRSITTGRPSSLATPTLSPFSPDSSATSAILHGRSSRHRRLPDPAEADDDDVIAARRRDSFPPAGRAVGRGAVLA